MEGREDRNCKFISVATFIDESGNVESFEKVGSKGVIAKVKDETDCPHAWSDLWRIFEIPKYGKTLSALTKEESHRLYSKKKDKSSLELFADWYLRRVDLSSFHNKH